MFNIPTEKDYSANWKNLGTLLVYNDKQFQFKSSVVIVELDNCLFDHITPNKLYDTRNKHNVNFNEEFIKHLSRDSIDKSLVILSNQINQNKLNIDMIKRKVEALIDKTKLPILAFFALTPNRFSKPHTGMWKLLSAYYKLHASANIQNAIVVSNEGGLIVETEKRTGIETKVAFKDTDRAFAHNICADYLTIDEYMDNTYGNPNFGKKIKFLWDQNIISPDIRNEYYNEISKITNVNIFRELGNFKNKDGYVIIIMGAPRCGKTQLSKTIIKKWRSSDFGKHNEIKRLGLDMYTKGRLFSIFCKLINDRISIVLDGCCDTESQRKEFLNHVKDKNIAVLFIEVNVGFEMARVFNHVCVEESKDEDTVLYKDRLYYIYKSMYRRPRKEEFENSSYIIYYPRIDSRDTVMKYRY